MTFLLNSVECSFVLWRLSFVNTEINSLFHFSCWICDEQTHTQCTVIYLIESAEKNSLWAWNLPRTTLTTTTTTATVPQIKIPNSSTHTGPNSLFIHIWTCRVIRACLYIHFSIWIDHYTPEKTMKTAIRKEFDL